MSALTPSPLPPLGALERLWLALVCLVRVIFDAQFAQHVAEVRHLLGSGAGVPVLLPSAGSPAALPAAGNPAEPAATPRLAAPAPAPAAPDTSALQLLALLQREGRFIDFCEEDLSNFPDADVGAAARGVHTGCRKALRSILQLSPVRTEAEGAAIAVPAGFDPSAVRLTGNVVGNPPFQGALRHHGWRAAEVRLSPPASGQDVRVLAPAEVELP